MKATTPTQSSYLLPHSTHYNNNNRSRWHCKGPLNYGSKSLRSIPTALRVILNPIIICCVQSVGVYKSHKVSCWQSAGVYKSHITICGNSTGAIIIVIWRNSRVRHQEARGRWNDWVSEGIWIYVYHLNGDQLVSLRDLDHSALGRFAPSSFVL